MKVNVIMKKNLKLILSVLSLISIISIFLLKKSDTTTHIQESSLPLVCITQIIEHFSLDEERRGILKALELAGYQDGVNVKIMYQNAQGNLGTAAQIAKSQISKKPAVMVAISTSSAQATLPIAASHEIPLVFTAVTNPIEAKLIRPITEQSDVVSNPIQKIYGVSDALQIEKQVHLIREFKPQAKRIGVIYNAGEMNSVHMVTALKIYCAAQGIDVIDSVASKTSDVAAATQNLMGRVDVIYIPNDNTAISAISSVMQVAEKSKVAVFTGDVGSVKKGAFATQGYDRFELGQKAGAFVVKILKGEPITKNLDDTHNLHIYVNEKARKNLGIEIPDSIRKDVILIGTDA
jgi:putative ABC transport system substrate-binding protein